MRAHKHRTRPRPPPCRPTRSSWLPTAASCGRVAKVMHARARATHALWRTAETPQRALAPSPLASSLTPSLATIASPSHPPAFRGDAHALAASRAEIRSHYLAAASVPPAEVAAKVADSDEAASFLAAHVVQGVLNERGNYAVTLEAHHADASVLVEPGAAVAKEGDAGGGGAAAAGGGGCCGGGGPTKSTAV